MFLPGVRAFGNQASSLPIHRLGDAITPAILAVLQNQGYAVIDKIFGDEIALQLRDEVKSLRNHMHKNCTHLVSSDNRRLLTPKKDIYEAELLQPETQALAPLCSLLQHDHTLRKALSPAPKSFDTNAASATTAHLSHQAIKLQWNAGDGGCFPMHFDSDASVDNRVITAIWYQNENWKPEHGGELRLYPFPLASPVDIAPILDRLVLFSSLKMVHRVLPSFTDRYCFTIWLSSTGGLQSFSPSEKHYEQRILVREALSREVISEKEAFKLLERVEELRRHALKWVYREEWEQSLLESHPEGSERDDVVARMKFEIVVIEKALRPLLPVLEKWSERSRTGKLDNMGLDCAIDWM
jgi:hypothetical protein